MKKNIGLVVIICMLLLTLTGCKKKFQITFSYENGEQISSVIVKKGESTTFPTTKEEVGYYYEWDKTSKDLTNIKSDMTVTAIKKEYQKKCVYYYNQTILKEEIANYSSEVSAPNYPEDVKNPSWQMSSNFENNMYLYEYHLQYDKEFNIVFKHTDGTLIDEKKVVENGSITLPITPEASVGYYYEWDKTNEDLTNIKSDMIVIAIKKEYQKKCVYYFDETILKQEIVNYSNEVSAPNYPETVKNPSWKLTSSFVDNMYLYEYHLQYDSKMGTISYYDGNKKLDLNPSTYWTNETIPLPTYEKENAKFIGWFVSDISLCRYNEYTGTTGGELVLYARFVAEEKPLDLPNSTYKFVDIKKIPHSSGNGTYVYQPVMPSEVSIVSVTQYTWSTSDSSIATVSAYSSITAKKAGFCVLTATLKTNPSVTINCVIRVSTEGVFFSSIEEANQPSIVEVTFVDKDNVVIEKQFVKKGQYTIPPTPPTYDNLAFNGWDHDIYNITENTTIQATYKEGINNYVGKKIAIIGDSISTYQDYIPKGYPSFYPYPTADVFDVNQTWWMQSINKLGAKLFVNNSYSGSCVATGGSSATSTDARLSTLVIGNEKPDVIIIYMGSNDCASSFVDLGSFRSYYKVMIRKVQKLCPNSEIVVCTLPTSIFYSSANQKDYNDAILESAVENQLKVIHLDEINTSDYLVDTAHPKKAGMSLIAEKVVEYLLK